jgi:hypothetical protein
MQFVAELVYANIYSSVQWDNREFWTLIDGHACSKVALIFFRLIHLLQPLCPKDIGVPVEVMVSLATKGFEH